MTSFHSNYCITLYITGKIYCTFSQPPCKHFFFNVLGENTGPLGLAAMGSIFQEINKADWGVFIF